MKLHNLSVIFIIIAMPLILITSYYISLQIDTINMQTAYNTKLLDSTKEAIDAFEINTVEWNADFSGVADSKRRDIMASINTFTTSFANNIGMPGTSKEYTLAYMPAIVYTLYDGYYIYSPADARVPITDDNDVGVVMTEKLSKQKDGGINIIDGGYLYPVDKSDEGKLLYEPKPEAEKQGTYYGKSFTLNPEDAKTEYKHILKPFAAYSEKVGDIVINYTLDNYVTIYGKLPTGKRDDSGNNIEEYISKSGYLIDTEKIKGITHNSISGIKFKEEEEINIEAETLSENISYKDESGTNLEPSPYTYVYEAEGNTKVYFDNIGNPFIIDNKENRIDLSENMEKYKKVTIPKKSGGTWTYDEIYQNLNTGKCYYKDKETGKPDLEREFSSEYIRIEKEKDYSAINYCVESFIFTTWVNSIAGDLNGRANYLIINKDNDSENKNSEFSMHKREVIKSVVESNLNQAITSYSRRSDGEYQLPNLTETDWDQILRNVSIITFIQNIPIGMKYYNNYAIATSTVNKEYVDPNEIYLNDYTNSETSDIYYHMPYCEKLEKTDLIGYRSIDFVKKSYTVKDQITNQSTKENYFKHKDQACYYCLVQKSLYTINKTYAKEKAYYTALAREKYTARRTKLPPEVDPVYYIDIQAVDSNNPDININGEFIIYKPDGTTLDYTGGKAKKSETLKILKSDVGEAYNIKASTSAPSVVTGIPDTGDLEHLKGVRDNELEEKSPYTSDSEIGIHIGGYDNSGIQFYYVNPNNVDYGSGENRKIYDNYDNTISSEVGTGFINVRLKYNSNYTKPQNARELEIYANINEYNNLTIVTNLKDIKGQVRLKFTNGNPQKTYYSEDTFNVQNTDTSIYCEIPGTEWYSTDWKVEVLNVANTTIAEGFVNYYTINDAEGLKDFADAVNGTQGSATGAKTDGRTFKLIADILNVEKINPIAGFEKDDDGDEHNDIYFNGFFDGQNHIIGGAEINTGSGYNCFGLFGWVGKPAKIENLVIDNIKVQSNSTTKDSKTGGLAGMCEEGESISYVTVQKSTISGTGYVGGIVGKSEKAIDNCTVINSTIGSGRVKLDNVSTNKKILNYSILDINHYCVGGIVGETNNKITTIEVSENCNINGGYVYYYSEDDGKYYLDEKAFTATGGVIGNNAYEQNIDSKFNTQCRVSGYDNVGGIVGFNSEGKNITNITYYGTVIGAGENIGGIVGCNIAGAITSCKNEGIVEGTGENIGGIEGKAKNVGGIVGCNYDKNIINCSNEGPVNGNKNVGGIVGITYKGWIDSCGNNGKVTGIKNSLVGDTIDLNNLLGFYNISGEDSTGTGGIAGKIHEATISRSYNNDNVICNYNGGGIVGINAGGTIKYCCNKNIITNEGHRDTAYFLAARVIMNRIGGICGVGFDAKILSSYNIAEIKGESGILNNPCGSATGGIVAFLVDDTSWIKSAEHKISTKYFEVDVNYLTTTSSHNEISYCYNSGNVHGKYDWATDELTYYNGAIVGYIGISVNLNLSAEVRNTTLLEDYYLNGTASGGRNGKKESYSGGIVEYKGLNETELKNQLYNWADKIKNVSEEITQNNYIYNTTAPVEEVKGYAGYGILWWELNDYNRVEFFVGSRYNINDVARYKAIADEHSTKLKIGEKEVILNDKNKKLFDKDGINTKFHSWIMLIKSGEYNLVASATDYGQAIKENYPINNTSQNKILALLHTGAEKTELNPNGNTSYNWNHSFTKNLPFEYKYNLGTPLADGTTSDIHWTKSNYQNKSFEYNSKFGDSNEENSDYIAQVYLDGLDGFFNNRSGKVSYSWEAVRIGERYKAGLWYWRKGSTKYPYTAKSTIEQDSKCTISVPMQSLKNATNGLELSYNPDTCTVTKADININFKYWINDNIISKLDFTGSAASLTERLGISQLDDNLRYQVSFGNVMSTENIQELKYSLYTTDEFVKDGNMNIRMDVRNSNALNSNNNENANVILSWDAEYYGIHIAITEIKLEVEYSINTNNNGIFAFYNL